MKLYFRSSFHPGVTRSTFPSFGMATDHFQIFVWIFLYVWLRHSVVGISCSMVAACNSIYCDHFFKKCALIIEFPFWGINLIWATSCMFTLLNFTYFFAICSTKSLDLTCNSLWTLFMHWWNGKCKYLVSNQQSDYQIILKKLQWELTYSAKKTCKNIYLKRHTIFK